MGEIVGNAGIGQVSNESPHVALGRLDQRFECGLVATASGQRKLKQLLVVGAGGHESYSMS
ncbi:hypothetical protein MBOL_32730 [Mycobacteroides abscessus subsp. bolletii BD]|nr:hypothetical protein MBOL_32730 [Mycobacteroides abscessus subsp. bolletii BD]